MTPPGADIAIVASAVRLPDAASVERLWSNLLEGRRAFRGIPPGRLDLAAYAAYGEALSVTPVKAGLISDWRFDRARHRIPARAYEATDLAHWLALDVAGQALRPVIDADGLAVETAAVVVGNTLTGEFSRAGSLALRAPFFDEVLAQAATAAGLDAGIAGELRGDFQRRLRDRLPTPNEESLAGALSNTIAGRIANYFDLRAGAFTVDAACASSLVAVAQAADLITTGQAELVVAGGVDLSLDPFELVGFSRVGALAADEMRVFDARANGFWPGEGAAFVVLMEAGAALRAGLPPLALLRGWGLSSDGAGGLIRPTSGGQALAIRRACERADVDPRDLDYVEAHGTGTPTGDPVEVRALASVREGAGGVLPIGSIKANIGHTKAAAGMAGLVKTVEALRRGVIPPHVGFQTPHPVFAEVDGRIRVAARAEALPEGRAALAGVSSFGFGGINAHLVLAGPPRPPSVVQTVLAGPAPEQDVEVFLFAACDWAGLAAKLTRLQRRSATLGWSELADAAAAAAREAGEGLIRAAVVARDADALGVGLQRAIEAATTGAPCMARDLGVFVGESDRPPRIGLLFPGQAAPVRSDPAAWGRRFPDMARQWARGPAAAGDDAFQTAVAQPAIVAASQAALDVLRRWGIEADAALGHSLGEVTAAAWAGGVDVRDLPDLVKDRGQICADFGAGGGAMLRVAAGPEQIKSLATGNDVVVACENAHSETVLAGPVDQIERCRGLAERAGLEVQRLPVSHAFHSPLMRDAEAPWSLRLRSASIAPLARALVSSVTGDWIDRGADLREVLARQLTSPVRFRGALHRLSERCDLLIEVGPGRGLARLAAVEGLQAVATDAFGASLRPLCEAFATAWVLGAALDPMASFRDRRSRAVDLDNPPELLANPCGRLGERATPPATEPTPEPAASGGAREAGDPPPAGETLIDTVRRVVADELGLTPDLVAPDDRFDTRLNLESLAVSRIVARAARMVGAPTPRAPTEFASATPRLLAEAIQEMRDFAGARGVGSSRVDGVDPWVRCYGIDWRAVTETSAAPAVLGSWRRRRSSRAAAAALVVAPTQANAEDMPAFVREVQAAAADPRVRRLAIVATSANLSGFARSVALERHFDSVRLLIVEPGAGWRLRRELRREVDGYAEVRLTSDGRRLSPVFRPKAPRTRACPTIGPNDVVLVTGGARGIAAECALRLAEESGCALLLCGRSAAADEAVAATLDRAAALGVRTAYLEADVQDRVQLQRALEDAAARMGAPTVLMHAPGANQPMALTALTADAVAATLGPKTIGLRNVLALAGATLQRVYAFGSIIGRLGLEGEAHYALANALQSEILQAFADAHPDCLALSLDWSVWGGVGMGERLGVIERLSDAGVDALSVGAAVEAFSRLVAGGAEGDAVVTSRFGPPPWLDLAAPPLPPLRFLDRPLVHYPGVELVVETEIWGGRDPYLEDHRLAGAQTLPGVMGMEAMAQVAAALGAGAATLARIGPVTFDSALAAPDGGFLKIRVCGLLRDDGQIHACIRSDVDDFASPAMTAVFGATRQAETAPPAPADVPPGRDASPLYGALFFHEGRFRRLAEYRSLSSRELSATFATDPGAPWFGAFDEPGLVLGDPGVRDAALHALQAAVAHRQVAPVEVASVMRRAGGAPVSVAARERASDADGYVFDIILHDAQARPVETWVGARFRGVGRLDPAGALTRAPWLCGAYLERLAREALDDPGLRVALGEGVTVDRADQRADLLRSVDAADQPGRGDGRPGQPTVSLSHGGCGLAVHASFPVGCDAMLLSAFDEPLPPGTALIEPGAGSGRASDDWVAGEALRKLGRRPPFRLAAAPRDGLPETVRVFASGRARVLVAHLPTPLGPIVVAIARALGPAAEALVPRLEPSHET